MKLSEWNPSKRVIVGVATALLVIQALFAFWLLTLLFYRAGAYFLDAGFYVYAIASERAPNNPEFVRMAWGDNVFLTHTTISPMGLMAILRPLFGIPMNFIVYLSLQHAALAAAGGALAAIAAAFFHSPKSRIITAGVVGAVFLPLSNIGMGSLAYPHVEIFGASAIALGLCCLVVRWNWSPKTYLLPLAIGLMIFGMLAREDLGGHIAISIAAAVACSSWRSFDKKTWVRAASIAGLGGLTTVALLLFQRVVMGSDGAFDISYSGTPAYAHITSGWYVLERFLYLIGSRLDLMVAVSAFIIGGFMFKKRELFAFPLALLPWVVLNATSVDPSKNALGIYGMFPVVIYFTTPLIAMSFNRAIHSSDPQTEHTARVSNGFSGHLVYIFAIVSLFLGGIGAGSTGGGYVYYSLLRYPVVGPGEISLTNKLVKNFSTEGSRIAVDDAVMTLNPVAHEETILISQITDTSSYDSVLFFPAFLLGEASVVKFFDGWIKEGRVISLECLPGGLVRADATLKQTPTPQTAQGRFNDALRCHPRPAL